MAACGARAVHQHSHPPARAIEDDELHASRGPQREAQAHRIATAQARGYSAPFRASSVSGSKQCSLAKEKWSFAFDPTAGTFCPG